MHSIGEKNKYMAFMFMKVSKDYFALGREGIHDISMEHAKDLAPFAHMLTHVVCTGVDGRYDQVTIVEADSLEEIHEATVACRMGVKAKFIDFADTIIGIKAPPRSQARKR